MRRDPLDERLCNSLPGHSRCVSRINRKPGEKGNTCPAIKDGVCVSGMRNNATPEEMRIAVSAIQTVQFSHATFPELYQPRPTETT